MAESTSVPERSSSISDRTFKRLAGFIESELGIKMPLSKKTMLQARLQKRMRALAMASFEDYCEYVFSPEGMDRELDNMLDVVTTNKTDFFREPRHFDYLVNTALPDLVRLRQCGVRQPLGVWSAGCSTGAEPYTLAMVLSSFAAQCERFAFEILATDISTRVLAKAREAIYRHEEIEPVPMDLRRRFLLRSKDQSKQQVRIVPELRACVRFQRLNFMDPDFNIHRSMDIIFCRNVIIYFDRQTQETVLNRLCRHLAPGGYMFMGHSETLNGLKVPLVQESATVYRKRGAMV